MTNTQLPVTINTITNSPTTVVFVDMKFFTRRGRVMHRHLSAAMTQYTICDAVSKPCKPIIKCRMKNWAVNPSSPPSQR
ncbi:hypothetical protein ACOMHN_056275 [Nucella lapillus]